MVYQVIESLKLQFSWFCDHDSDHNSFSTYLIDELVGCMLWSAYLYDINEIESNWATKIHNSISDLFKWPPIVPTTSENINLTVRLALYMPANCKHFRNSKYDMCYILCIYRQYFVIGFSIYLSWSALKNWYLIPSGSTKTPVLLIFFDVMLRLGNIAINQRLFFFCFQGCQKHEWDEFYKHLILTHTYNNVFKPHIGLTNSETHHHIVPLNGSDVMTMKNYQLTGKLRKRQNSITALCEGTSSVTVRFPP